MSKVGKAYIGIDPGASGAMAIIRGRTVIVLDFEDPSALSILKEINLIKQPCKAVIEKVASMPGQGVSSTFKFGTNFGAWIGRLEALDIPFDFVTPQKWKKAMFDSMPRGDDVKAMSVNRALRIYPTMADRLKRKKDHNRAEAILLAEYARITDK